MKRPAVFFDRDNTLIVNDGYLGNPAEVVLIEGAADTVARVRALGYAAVVFSNQSGVARGKFTEEAVHAVNARMDEMLLDQNPGAVIDRHEFCPFHPEGVVDTYKRESDLRKPQPGMIYQAAEKLALDLSRSWVIGDAPRDIEAGKAAGCRTILFRDGKIAHSPAALEPAVESDYVVSSLAEAGAMVEIATRIDPPAITENDMVIQLPQTPAEPTSEAPPTPTSTAPVQTSSEAVAVVARALTPALAHASEVAAGDAQMDGVIENPPSQSSVAKPVDHDPGFSARIETLLQQLIQETRRNHEHPHHDFSVSKLMAGIVQVVALAALFLAYLRHDTPAELPTLFYALTFQSLTIALLTMGRQR